MSARRVLLWGDVCGAQETFREHLRAAVDRYGPFDVCLCLGDFFGAVSSTVGEASQLRALAAELIKEELAVNRVFIVDRPQKANLGHQLREAFPSGVENLTSQVTLMGAQGRFVFGGLRIAYFSSCEVLESVGRPEEGEVVDICLLTAWPDNIQNGLAEADRVQLHKLMCQNGDEGGGAASSAAALFAAKLEPARYYIATGGPRIFYERPPFQSNHREVVSRFISLAPMSSPLNVPSEQLLLHTTPHNRKFVHCLRLIPWDAKHKFVFSSSPFSSSPQSSSSPPATKKARLEQQAAFASPSSSRWSHIRKSSDRLHPAAPKNSNSNSSSSSNSSSNNPVAGVESAGGGGWSNRWDSTTSNTPSNNAADWKPDSPASEQGGPIVLAVPTSSSSSSSLVPNAKDAAPAAPDNAGARVLYVSNVPYTATREELFRCLETFGPLVDVRLPKFSHGNSGSRIAGRAWVTFERAKDAEAAYHADNITLFGRTLRLVYANIQDQSKVRELAFDKRSNDDADFNPPTSANKPWPPASEDAPHLIKKDSPEITHLQLVPIDVRPHSDCWFCLYNPSCEKKLIVSVAEEIYIAIARGGIVPQHLMLLPVSHQPCVALFNSSLLRETARVMRDLRQYFASQGMALVFFERYGPMKMTRAMHTQIHAVPIPLHLVASCHEAFESKAVTQNFRLREVSLESIGEELASHGERMWPERSSDREQLIANQSYYLIDLPINGEAGSLAADRRRTMMCMCEEGSRRLNLHYARETLCDVLSAPERVYWKTCVTSRAEEEHWASHVRLGFEQYMMGGGGNAEADSLSSESLVGSEKGSTTAETTTNFKLENHS